MGLLAKIFGCKKQTKEPVVQRNLMNIQCKDIVLYYEKEYEVFAVVEWMEEGYTWKEYKFKDGEDVCWISAEIDDGEVQAGLYRIVKDLHLPDPLPSTITYQGIQYQLEEQGKAVGLLISEAGKQNYQCRYYQYESEDGKHFLSVEDFSGDREISVGFPILASEINILPGV